MQDAHERIEELVKIIEKSVEELRGFLIHEDAPEEIRRWIRGLAERLERNIK